MVNPAATATSSHGEGGAPVSPFSPGKAVLGTHAGQTAWRSSCRGALGSLVRTAAPIRGRPATGPWMDSTPTANFPYRQPRGGLKATFPRRSCWSPARPQAAPLTALPAHSPEHLRAWSEGNQAVSITCQEVPHNQCLFIS